MPAFLAVTNTQADTSRDDRAQRGAGARRRGCATRGSSGTRIARRRSTSACRRWRRSCSTRSSAATARRRSASSGWPRWIVGEVLGRPEAADRRRHGRPARQGRPDDRHGARADRAAGHDGRHLRARGRPARAGLAGHLLPLPAGRRRGRRAAVARQTSAGGGHVGGACRWPTSSTRSWRCSRRASGRPARAIRSACGGRRTAWLRILVDLPELTGLDAHRSTCRACWREARAGLSAHAEAGVTLPAETAAEQADLTAFLAERLRYLFEQRGFGYDEVNAIAGSSARPDRQRALRRAAAARGAAGGARVAGLRGAGRRVQAREEPGARAEGRAGRGARPADRAGRGWRLLDGVPRARRGDRARRWPAATIRRRSGWRRVSARSSTGSSPTCS